jgi:aminoglycoside phosphotransferase (APT) family kinase protein
LQPIEVAAARQWLQEEAEAARELAGQTVYATPEPVAIGEPGAGYPLPWSVQTWVPGTPAGEEDPSGSVPFAHDMAAFILGVRSIDTRGRTFARAGRGGDLRRHDAWMRECFARSEDLVDVARFRQLWASLRDLPRTRPDVMTHGDLTPGNVLVADGRLAGVIDVGGLGPADPALDLVAAWHLLQSGPREVLRLDLGVGELEWRRGQAWALEQAMGVVWYYADSNPAMHRMGRTTLQRILDS